MFRNGNLIPCAGNFFVFEMSGNTSKSRSKRPNASSKFKKTSKEKFPRKNRKISDIRDVYAESSDSSDADTRRVLRKRHMDLPIKDDDSDEFNGRNVKSEDDEEIESDDAFDDDDEETYSYYQFKVEFLFLH